MSDIKAHSLSRNARDPSWLRHLGCFIVSDRSCLRPIKFTSKYFKLFETIVNNI